MSNKDFDYTSPDYAKKILNGIGGKDNIKLITNCITRLRLVLSDISKVDENLLLNETGATKVIIDGNDVHIVYGLRINEIKKAVDEEIQKEKITEGYINDVNIKKIVEGLGGKDNIKSIDNCLTRLRVILNDTNLINQDLLLKETHASKVIILDNQNAHIVYGLKIESIRKAIEEELN